LRYFKKVLNPNNQVISTTNNHTQNVKAHSAKADLWRDDPINKLQLPLQEFKVVLYSL